MLQIKTIEPGTFTVLEKLMAIPELANFILVGGTALALYYGHRLSVDIDLFSTDNFENETIISIVENKCTGFTYRKNSMGIFGYVDNVKVDFVKHHHHPLISTPLKYENLTIMGLEDIIAMKINAILKRAVKKDFWDIAELLKHYSIENFIDFYELKYPSQQLLITIPQAITFFDDAEESPVPVSLKGQTWESVKKSIQKKVSQYLK